MAKLTDFIKGNPLLAAALFVFLVVYSNSLSNNFQRDDLPHIVNNDFIRDLSGVPKLFSRDYFQLNGAVAWRPAVAAVRMLEYKAFGLDHRAWRAFDLLLHALNAALLCWLFLRVTGSPAAAAAGAALFLLHPAHTEALNYVSNGQCDLLCLLFLCLSFLAYLDRRPLASLAAFILALLSKEMALAFPFLLAAYAYFYGDRKQWQVPAAGAALAALFAAWRLFYFRAGPGFIDNAPAEGVLGFSLAGGAAALVKFPVLLVHYFKLLLWPAALSVEIDRLLPEAGLFSALHIALAWLLCLALAGAAAFFYRKNRFYAFSLLCFILALVPVSGLVPLTSLIQEHFVYIPSVFFCLLAGLGFARASASARYRGLAAALAGLVLLGAAGRIWARNLDWRSPLTLAASDLRSFPGSIAAAVSLAAQKSAAGDYAGALELCRGAAGKPGAGGEAYFLMGELYLRQGLKDKAVEAARRGLAADQGRPDAWVNAARLYARAGLRPEALAAAGEAARRFPYFEPAYAVLGELLLLENKPRAARAMFAEAVRLNSRSQAARRLAELNGEPPAAR